MRKNKVPLKELKAWGGKKFRASVALCCITAALFSAATIATGTNGGHGVLDGASESSSSGEGERSPVSALVSARSGGKGLPAALTSTHERVLRHEALPCTEYKDPINFEIFSAGPSVAGLPLNSVQRRCGGSTSADEPPANLINYIYGHCEIAEGATGCEPPLEIQTWPACQRALGDYSFEGKPLPYRRLSSRGGAVVVEIKFMVDNRIEVYTKSSTIVIFAEDPVLARKALALLRSQEDDEPPATQAEELKGKPDESLAPPSDGAMEGELPCRP